MVYNLTNGELKYQVQRSGAFDKTDWFPTTSLVRFITSNYILYFDENRFYKYDPVSKKDVCIYEGTIFFQLSG